MPPLTARPIIIGADHAGFPLKTALIAYLIEQGCRVTDIGCPDEAPVDYPEIAATLVQTLKMDPSALGILCCGSGVGMAIGANRFTGVRAVVAHDLLTARLSREHNDCNVLCLGARLIAAPLACEITAVFLNATPEARHAERVALLDTACCTGDTPAPCSI